MAEIKAGAEAGAARASLMELATGFRASRAIYAAAKLKIADLLAERPMSSGEVAAATKTDPLSVGRLMRALSALGILEEREADRFVLAPMGAALRSDVAGSIRASVLFIAGDTAWRTWGGLLYSIETGDAAFEHVLGMQTFDYWASHPEECTIHDQVMAAASAPVAAAVVTEYDFTGFDVVVDVGGGTGTLLAEVLAKHSHLHGILYDQPHVVAGANEVLAARGVADRCRIEAGSFFESVPYGGDAYILKSVIHDWDDRRATAILAACRKAMAPTATLLLVEQVLPERTEQGRSLGGYFLDLEMLVRTPGGRERTAGQFRDLLAGAGFRLRRIIPTASPSSVIEGRPEG